MCFSAGKGNPIVFLLRRLSEQSTCCGADFRCGEKGLFATAFDCVLHTTNRSGLYLLVAISNYNYNICTLVGSIYLFVECIFMYVYNQQGSSSSAAVKAKETAAKGTKSISSFFAKK